MATNANGLIDSHYSEDGILKQEYDTGGTPGSTPQTLGTTPIVKKPVVKKPIVKKPVVKPKVSAGAAIVPGVAHGSGQINVVDAAGQIAADPGIMIDGGTSLVDQVKPFTAAEKASGVQKAPPTVDADALAIDPATGQAATAANQQKLNAVGVDAAKSQPAVENAAMTAAQGTVSDQAKVDANGVVIDTAAVAAGTTPTGEALKQAAQQNISNIIDTSTMSGKALAAALGEGNYTDAKATLKGQLDILQAEFVDPTTGEPKIPAWAAGTARNVSRIASFTGMTGTAATMAMAQALMEASLPVAQQDAQFFQTLTVKNLDNRQESTINRANVLAKMDLANMDARMTAAVTNAQNFMKMDLANLDNEQQANVINTQSRVQSILEDTKAENTARLFVAQSQNEKDMFYSNLNSSIDQFNTAQKNSMTQFNTGEVNDAKKFNSDLENNREQFYKNMQFQVDTSNAKWRQTITLTENQQKFEAAATDVKNKVGLSTEMLNRLWDRSDALLDYAWKSADNDAERKNKIALVKLQAASSAADAEAEGTGNLLGTLLGIGGSLLMGAFGF